MIFISFLPSYLVATVPSHFSSWRRDPGDPFLREWMNEEMRIILKISRGKVLDIGCGDGFVLEILRSRGLEAHGIDINRSFVERARKKAFPASGEMPGGSRIPITPLIPFSL